MLFELLAQTSKPADAPANIATGIAICSLCANLYQWIRARRPLLKVKSHSQNGEGDDAYKRFFVVDLFSFGADVYDLDVRLVWTLDGKEGLQSLQPLDDIPNPLKLGQSRRFYLMNVNPHEPTLIENVPVKDVALVVASGIRELKRINGTKFADVFDSVFRVDKLLPPPPQPKPRAENDWLRRRPNW